MTSPLAIENPAVAGVSARVRELQGRITRMQAPKLDSRALPTPGQLAPLFPGGALQAGASYSVIGSTSLAMSLLAGPSAAGAWCGVIGVPGFGVEAAADAGIDLDRLVLVPQPGAHWLSVTSAMADVAGILIAAAPGRVAPSDAARLSARLRQRETTLIVLGQWSESEATLRISSSRWSGLGVGHGHLEEREVTVTSMLRQGLAGRPRTATLRLSPTTGTARQGGTAAAAASAAVEQHTPLRRVANL